MDYLNKYTELRSIGKGSYGEACLVVNKLTNVQFISKKISTSSMPASEVSRVTQEVTLMQKFSHPHIVTYKESFISSTMIIIVMENCEGGDLMQLISYHRSIRSSFPEPLILDWLGQMASALSHIHSMKIIHRDLKPSNIFITNHGKLKLGDFGVSKALDRTDDVALTQIGTPLYMSPEVCDNLPYTYKSDIWSLGCIIYELATFERPFDGRSLLSLALNIIEAPHKPLSSSYSNLLRTVVDIMLEKKSSNRLTAKEITSYIGFHEPVESSDMIVGFGESGVLGKTENTLGFESFVKVKGFECSVSNVDHYDDDFESSSNEISESYEEDFEG